MMDMGMGMVIDTTTIIDEIERAWYLRIGQSRVDEEKRMLTATATARQR